MLWSAIPLVCPTNSFTGDIVFRMSQSCVQTSLYIHIVYKAILLKKKKRLCKSEPITLRAGELSSSDATTS